MTAPETDLRRLPNIWSTNLDYFGGERNALCILDYCFYFCFTQFSVDGPIFVWTFFVYDSV